MFVLDTDALSIAGPASRFATAEAESWRRWVAANEGRLAVSVVTVFEVRFGIERLRAKGSFNRVRQLEFWLATFETAYRDRLIDLTPRIADRAGELLAAAVAAEASPSSEDALVAATADIFRGTLISRNAKHMRAFGINVLDPLGPLPGPL